MPETPEGAILGVDVGGTKLAVGHVVGREVVASVEHPTPLTSTADLIAALEAAVDEVTARSGTPARARVRTAVASRPCAAGPLSAATHASSRGRGPTRASAVRSRRRAT